MECTARFDFAPLLLTATALPAVRAKYGRPTIYSEAIARRFIERIAETNDSVRKICKDDGFPHRVTINRWLLEHADFRLAYTIACRGRVEDIAYECLEIADDGDRDTTVTDDSEGMPRVEVNKEHIARTEQRLRERHWLCAKLAPKRFGDDPDPEPALEPAAAPKEINPKAPVVIEQDPLYGAIQAWARPSTV